MLTMARWAGAVWPLVLEMKKNTQKASNQYSCRLDDALQRDFEECLGITGMEPGLLLREAIKAFVEEVKATGEIRLPIAIVPKKAKIGAPSGTGSTAARRGGTSGAEEKKDPPTGFNETHDPSPAPRFADPKPTYSKGKK